MSDTQQTQQIQNRAFQERPVWKADETFPITGRELEIINNLLDIFAPAVSAMQSIFARGLSEGKIQLDYTYIDDGSPVPADVIAEHSRKMTERFSEQLKKQQEHLEQKVKENAQT